MPLTPDEERRVARALEEAAAEGRRAGEGASLRRVVAARARRTLRADYAAARAVLERLGDLAQVIVQLADLFLPASRKRWQENMRPVIADVAEAVTAPKEEVLETRFDLENPAMRRFLDDYVSELADRLSDTTYRQVMEVVEEAQAEGLSVADTAERLQEKAGIQTESRAKLIARNELQRTSKGASWVQASESGVVSGKIRREQDDARTRPEHRLLDGEERAIDEPYSNGEMWCGQTDINCRGYDEFVIDFDALESEDDARVSSAGGGDPDLDPERVSGGGGGGRGGGGGPDDPDHEFFRRGTIDPGKFENYLFDPDHRDNQGKAEGWRRVFGLQKGDAALADSLIREQLDRAAIVERDPRGRYRRWELVISDFRGPNGNVGPLLTAWALDPEKDRPHLSTAFPRPR